jgi:uncharacterized protein (TIGR03118 family)
MRLGPCRIVIGGLILLSSAVARGDYIQFNIVSDVPGLARDPVDPSLKNPWGMAFSGMSPFWVANQGANNSTLYNALNAPSKLGLTVAMDHPGPGPTGIVFNSTTSDFQIPAPGGTTVKSAFIFDTLDGTIQGWNPGSVNGLNKAETVATVAGAAFTGLTLASIGMANYLYAADATGHIVVFDSTFTNVSGTTFAGKFVDPNPVPGFTPFNIQRLNVGGVDRLFVTYAAATSTGAPLAGGYVDEYDTAGNFLGRIATNGPINSPWGVVLAPAAFRPFGGDLLIGNLFDSKINAYNISGTTPVLDGSITVNTGFTSPVGLWALFFGNGSTGNPNTLYFTAGINDQKDGLFGQLIVPEPGSAVLLVIGAMGCGAACRRRARAA